MYTTLIRQQTPDCESNEGDLGGPQHIQQWFGPEQGPIKRDCDDHQDHDNQEQLTAGKVVLLQVNWFS